LFEFPSSLFTADPIGHSFCFSTHLLVCGRPGFFDPSQVFLVVKTFAVPLSLFLNDGEQSFPSSTSFFFVSSYQFFFFPPPILGPLQVCNRFSAGWSNFTTPTKAKPAQAFARPRRPLPSLFYPLDEAFRAMVLFFFPGQLLVVSPLICFLRQLFLPASTDPLLSTASVLRPFFLFLFLFLRHSLA